MALRRPPLDRRRLSLGGCPQNWGALEANTGATVACGRRHANLILVAAINAAMAFAG
jgi:hypothetical protein